MISKFKLKKKQKNKKKKGFTLVELLAVIVILAVIMVITIPTVIGSMNNAKLKTEEIFIASIEKSIGNFIEKELQYSDYTFEEPKKDYVTEDIANKYRVAKVLLNEDGAKKDITFELFDELGYYPKDDLVNPKNENKCDSNSKIELYKNKSKNEYYYYTKLDCLDYEFNTLPTPEEPDLSGGLIPIIYDETKGSDTHWFVADPSSDWYNYEEQRWANGVVVTPTSYSNTYFKDNEFQIGTEISSTDWRAMFVWIPRFSYTIGCTDNNNCYGYRIEGAAQISKNTPGAIDIKFTLLNQVDKYKNKKPNYKYEIDDNGYPTNNRKPDNWLTHPAFSWDKDGDGKIEDNEEIPGFWFAKFETTGDSNIPTILPEMTSLSTDIKTSIDITNIFFNTSNYSISSTSSDIHVSKNSEWGAVAYLSQSKYGKYGNSLFSGEYKEVYNNNGFLTGRSSGEPTRYSYNSESTSAGVYTYNRIDGSFGPVGAGASTTGNVYGVYDMSGGRQEYVMGNYNLKVGSMNSTNSFNYMKTWLQIPTNYKYLDIYVDSDIQTSNQYRTQKYASGGVLNKWIYVTTVGHGLFETNNWYEDSVLKTSDFSNNGYAWLKKGGARANSYYTGIFNTSLGTGKSGNYEGFRITYIPKV